MTTLTHTSKLAFALTTAWMFAGIQSAFAVSIGTVAAPLPASITVGGTVTYTATNFQFLNNSATGGGNLYQAGDINIDLATGGGLTALLTFSKNSNGPTPGVVFLANPGEATAYTFSYTLTVTPAVPGSGTVDYTNLANSFADSHLGNGLASVQTIVSPVNSNVFTGSPNNSKVLSGQPSAISVGNIVTVTGNTGNASIISYTNLLSASFTPVPEPSSFVLLGLGCAGLWFVRHRKN